MLSHCKLCCVAAFAAAYAAVRVLIAFWTPVSELIVKYVTGTRRSLSSMGKWAIVTGGSDGIGKAMAVRLAEKGLNILLVARNQSKLDEAKEEVLAVDGYTGVVDTMMVDFSDRDLDYENVFGTKIKQLGEVGILINNVGLSYPSAQYYTELSASYVDDLIHINLRSTLQLTRLVLPGMKERNRGVIVCVGSGASELPSEPLYAGYASMKAAVEGFCRSLHVECAKSNILVQCQTPLLVVSKLSKIRKPSLTVASPQSYARSAVSSMEVAGINDHPTVSPWLMHSVMLSTISLLPRKIWNGVRLKMVTELRKRYMKKQSESEPSSGKKVL